MGLRYASHFLAKFCLGHMVYFPAPNKIGPEDGGSKPRMLFKGVVFPEPFGPKMQAKSPGPTL